jgi:hypothetical protein
MTNEEIKQKIATLQKGYDASTDENRKEMYKKGIEKLEAMIEKEPEPQKPIKKAKPVIKKPARKKKTTNVKTHGHESKTAIDEQPTTKKKTIIRPVKTHGHASESTDTKKKVKITKKNLLKQAIETQVKPIKKTLIIKKKDKEEKHIIDTAFGNDIKDAVLSLNKARFVVKEQKNRKTGQVETVHHSQEYRNAKSIQNKVDRIFNSSIADIAEKDKTKKKKIEELAKELRDIHALWLNEIDIIISNGETDDMENIKKLLIGLLKEARKNDEDNKWRNAAGLDALAKKYGI